MSGHAFCGPEHGSGLIRTFSGSHTDQHALPAMAMAVTSVNVELAFGSLRSPGAGEVQTPVAIMTCRLLSGLRVFVFVCIACVFVFVFVLCVLYFFLSPSVWCCCCGRAVASVQDAALVAGALPVVIQALEMHSGNPKVAQLGCAALNHLTQDNPANQVSKSAWSEGRLNGGVGR